MDARALASRFAGRGDVEEAFKRAFQVLREALGALDPTVRERAFASGNRWRSVEVICSLTSNTVHYDGDHVVFHAWPVFELTDGKEQVITGDDGLSPGDLAQMQSAVTVPGWQVRGPTCPVLRSVAPGLLNKALTTLFSTGASEDDTLGDHLTRTLEREVAQLRLPTAVNRRDVARRALGLVTAPTVADLRKLVTKAQGDAIAGFVRAGPDLVERHLAPIERAIGEFAIELLRGVPSALVAGPAVEMARLQSELRQAIQAIQASGNETALDVLNEEMARLGDVDNVTSCVEGIVFSHRGKAYKLTGAFAPAHQLLALFKYGRKGIPKMDISTRHALEGVGPITLKEFRAVWPHVQADLRALGVTDVEPVGSTGKRQLMGDVDIAGRFSGTRDELFDRAVGLFGSGNVAKVGATIVSVRHWNGQKSFQIDVMLGDPTYLRWARHAGAEDSPAKGAIRNVLFNAVAQHASAREFPSMQGDLDRTRYVIDWDRGLFRVMQARRGANGQPVKRWTTLARELVSDDPNRIVEHLLGPGVQAQDILCFEDLVQAIRTAPATKHHAGRLLRDFAQDMRNVALATPKVLGNDPVVTLAYIDDICVRKGDWT